MAHGVGDDGQRLTSCVGNTSCGCKHDSGVVTAGAPGTLGVHGHGNVPAVDAGYVGGGSGFGGVRGAVGFVPYPVAQVVGGGRDTHGPHCRDRRRVVSSCCGEVQWRRAEEGTWKNTRITEEKMVIRQVAGEVGVGMPSFVLPWYVLVFFVVRITPDFREDAVVAGSRESINGG